MVAGDPTVDQDGLQVDVSRHISGVLVTVSGELDLASAGQLEARLDAVASNGGGRVILDLRSLRFSDAAGVHVIERAAKRLGSRLVVCGPRPSVRRIMEVAHLDGLVRVSPPQADESDLPASNLAYVRHLWDASQTGDAQRLARLIPDDVIWKPLLPEGDRAQRTHELIELWAGSSGSVAEPANMLSVGDDVLVTHRLDGGDGPEVWTLFRFEGRRLAEAVTCPRWEDALAARRRRAG
jgi:anti-anti-sigma factor